MLVGILNAAATAAGGGGGEGCLVQFIRYEYPKVFSLLIKKQPLHVEPLNIQF